MKNKNEIFDVLLANKLTSESEREAFNNVHPKKFRMHAQLGPSSVYDSQENKVVYDLTYATPEKEAVVHKTNKELNE